MRYDMVDVYVAGRIHFVKLQDIGFVTILIILIVRRKLKAFVFAGLVCFVLAIPLFALHIFFTAERLTWYAVAFILTYTIISYFHPHTVQ